MSNRGSILSLIMSPLMCIISSFLHREHSGLLEEGYFVVEEEAKQMADEAVVDS